MKKKYKTIKSGNLILKKEKYQCKLCGLYCYLIDVSVHEYTQKHQNALIKLLKENPE